MIKKGMVFGIDGVLMKDGERRVAGGGEESPSPEDGTYEKRTKPVVREYTARTIGRTEVYVLQRQVLEGLFDLADLISTQHFPRELTKQDLQKICSDYS